MLDSVKLLAKQSKIPSKQLTLVDRSKTYAHNDPNTAYPKNDFVKYLKSIPEAPNRRDDGRMLAETAIRALADLKQTVGVAAQNNDALLFRLLPPPG